MRHLMLAGLAVVRSPAAENSSPSGLATAGGSAEPTEGVIPDVPAAPDAEAPEAPKPAPKPARARAKPDADDGMVEAVVRRGTVVTGTFDKPISVGPGGTVRLPAEDVAALRADGVLVDPDGVELPAFDGPTVGRG